MSPRPEAITILMPCRAQPRALFLDAVRSVTAQTSPLWRLLIIIDEDSPAELRAWIGTLADDRIGMLVAAGGLARALNDGMRHAETAWVAILLADDRYDPRAIEILQRHIAAAPAVDFFHSARREIDIDGRVRSAIQPSRARVTAEAFRTLGSPVKHLLCWRRAAGLAIGGMDEALTIGPDDYDFPWRMLEAGARFQAIPDCLYEYRVHHTAHRITTHHPLRAQLASLTAMFRKHGVPDAETAAYLQHATDTYLVKEMFFDFEDDWRQRVNVSCHREAGPERLADFVTVGFLQRHFFPHRVYQLPKAGIDGMKLAQRMSGIRDPSRLAQIVLFGLSPAIDRLPPDVFFDDDVLWHQQQYGRLGQVASANIAFDGDRLYGSAYTSDLVQRISRRRELKTRVENVFKGWHHLLLNALMNVALDYGTRVVYSPTAALAMTHTDPKRAVQPALFARVYDDVVQQHLVATQERGWWCIEVAANRDRVVRLDKDVEVTPRAAKTIAICHDIERGHGHRASDPALAVRADAAGDAALDRMLAIERAAGVRATYSVVGTMLGDVRGRIAAGGHAVAFHSYDHAVVPTSAAARVLRLLRRQDPRPHQLERCREVDYRLKGYRPPQSRLTADLSDANLSLHGFEWLTSSAWSLGFREPRMQNGIVKIPILFDDYEMFRNGVPFGAWREKALALIDAHPFVAFSLHDCYAEFWLPHYAEFLAEVRARGQLSTLDEVAAAVTLAQARWT